MSKITFNDVRKEYSEGNIVAIEGFDFEIEDGEFVSIVGPSGSGKSTLLRMIAGLEEISGGEIAIGDRVVNDVPPQDRGVAMVFQNYALYPHMSVRKNMSYGLKLTTDFSAEEIDERVEESAEMMGIGDLLEKKPGNLSGGQQQRVATGRAIVRDPEVFLMDEPLSNLDAKLRMHMRTELQRIQNDLNTTTVYVTHDQEEALTMSDRIVVLSEGVLQQVGTPDDVYHRPANLFVAEFIGSPSMNFFEVELEGESLVGEGFDYELSTTQARRIRERQTSTELVLGVRPEHIHLADERTDRSIRVQLDVLEPAGSDNYLYLDLDGQECTVRTPSDVKPNEGELINVTFDDANIHVFDTESETNLLVGFDESETAVPSQTVE
jgi:multiple sugar transport system ATP-binding protein